MATQNTNWGASTAECLSSHEPPVPAGASTCDFMPHACLQSYSRGRLNRLGVQTQAAVFEFMLYYAWGVGIEDNVIENAVTVTGDKAIQLLQLYLIGARNISTAG